MDKYQIALLANVRKQLQEWTDQNKEIPHEEVYRFCIQFLERLRLLDCII